VPFQRLLHYFDHMLMVFIGWQLSIACLLGSSLRLEATLSRGSSTSGISVATKLSLRHRQVVRSTTTATPSISSLDPQKIKLGSA